MNTQHNASTLAAPTMSRLSRARASRWAPLPVVLAGTFMVVLDFFIVNVALPSVQHDLHASGSAIEWVVAGYSLTSAVFLITAARLGDQIGRRRTFSLGLGLFTLSSAACGVAGSAEVLGSARLVQGVGAALVMPNVLSIIGVTYTRIGSRACARRIRAGDGPRRGLRAADRRRAGAGQHRRPRLAQLLPHQRSGGSARALPAAAAGCASPEPSRAAGSTSSGRCSSPRG
jgi:hypothetical protein